MSGWRRGRLAIGALLALCGALSLAAGIAGAQDGGWQLEHVLGRGRINELDVSPDGERLAVASSQGVWLYSLPELEDIAHLLLQQWGALDVSWSPDGQQLALIEHSIVGTKVTLWQPESGAESGALPVLKRYPDKPVYNLEWSPLGDELAIFSGQNIQLLDIVTGALLAELDAENRVGEIAWAPNGERLAVTVRDSGDVAEDQYISTLQIWDVAGGTITAHWSPYEMGYRHYQSFNGLSWSPDGRKVAAGAKNDVWVVDALNGELLHELQRDSDARGTIKDVAWSPDGRRIAANGASADGNIQIWDAETAELQKYLDIEFEGVSLAWTAGGEHLLAANTAGWMQTWDVGKANTLATRDQIIGYDIRWLDDQRLQLPGRIFHVDSGREEAVAAGRRVGWYDYPSPDGRFIAVDDRDSFRILDAITGELIHELTLYENWKNLRCSGSTSIYSSVFSWAPNGANVATIQKWSCLDAEVKRHTWIQFWQLGDEPLLLNEIEEDGISNVFAWAHDSRTVAKGYHEEVIEDGSRFSNQFVRIHDVFSGQLLLEISIPGYSDSTIALAWSPDGRYLARTTRSRYLPELEIWEVNLEENHYHLRWETVIGSSAYGLAWSLDGNRLVTISDNHEFTHSFSRIPAHQLSAFMIWDVASGQVVANLSGEVSRTMSAHWSPDGQRIALHAGAYNFVQVWRAPGD